MYRYAKFLHIQRLYAAFQVLSKDYRIRAQRVMVLASTHSQTQDFAASFRAST